MLRPPPYNDPGTLKINNQLAIGLGDADAIVGSTIPDLYKSIDQEAHIRFADLIGSDAQYDNLASAVQHADFLTAYGLDNTARFPSASSIYDNFSKVASVYGPNKVMAMIDGVLFDSSLCAAGKLVQQENIQNVGVFRIGYKGDPHDVSQIDHVQQINQLFKPTRLP